MHLWNEYEGKNLAGNRLGQLIRSEGRSAFFMTVTPDGQPAILRLTEPHFDGAELVDRWQRVAAISDAGLQSIKYAGQAKFDTVTLACCLLEPVDEVLVDVLGERVLSQEETRQIAIAVAGALAALHAAGLVHEHVTAANVFAIEERITLRSDCVRECEGDFEADTPEVREALRSRDVRDLGLMLLQCFGLDREGSTAKLPPGAFGGVIRGALDGTMNAGSIVAALQIPKSVPFIAALHSSPASDHAGGPGSARANAPITGKPISDVMFAASRPMTSASSDTDSTRNLTQNLQHDTLSTRDKARTNPRLSIQQLIRRNTLLGVTAAVALLCLFLWGITRHVPSASRSTTPRSDNTSKQPESTIAHSAIIESPAISERQRTQHAVANSGVRTGWHVIAYTYNYEKQAQSKVMHLKRKYVSLQPQLFSPTGHAPYFVALGGPSDAASATAIRDRARQAGLPRDTYARNF